MTRTVRRSNKRDLFIVGTAAALALAPHAFAAEQASAASEVDTLRSENAQLRSRLAEMEKKLARANASHYGLKKLNSGYANGDGAHKTSAGMTCGANMGKSPAGMTCGANMKMSGETAGAAQSAGGKTAAEMTCGANMMFKMPAASLFYYNPVFGGSEDMFHTHPEGMWMFNVRWMHSEKDGLQAGTTQSWPRLFGQLPADFKWVSAGVC